MKKSLILFVFILISLSLSYSQKIICTDCHENLILNSAHNKVINCNDCHRDILNDNHTKGSALEVKCENCHIDNNLDFHNDVIKVNKIDAPNCKFCHGTHNIKKVDTIKNPQLVFCNKCHKNIVLTSYYHNNNKNVKNCNNCHSKNKQMYELKNSVHSKLNCSNCHGYVVKNIETHKVMSKEGIKADCYLCHVDIANKHKESIHGVALTEGVNEAAQCWDCHGSHSVDSVKSKKSLIYPTNLVKTCGKCHDNKAFVKKFAFAIKAPGKMYSNSIHGKLVSKGENAANCITCHGSHDIKNRVQDGSKIASFNLPNTCENCHKKVVSEYKQSIHWVAVKKGVRESPSCNDCHSEHNIQKINTNNKRLEIRKIQSNTCLQCHQNLLLSERYGISSKSVSNYEDSYHGLATTKSNDNAALCVDCHEVHKILPKENPNSSINKQNIVLTCKKCHKDATSTFANSYSHITQVSKDKKIEDIIKLIYILLIIFVVGFMLIHNLLILFHELVLRYKTSKNEIRIPRFTKNELIQHTVLLLSFIILAITGFQLKFPESLFGKIMYYIGINEELRQLIHRVSAIIMILLSIYHVLYLMFTNRGREVFKSITLKFYDISEAFNNILYLLHFKKKKPEFQNFSYIEKIEYWALIWGTIVMAFTGFILWFPTVVGNWAPLWFIKVSQIIHFYEAILATLAIIIWHWFFVIFHPKEYPLSFVCIDGFMPVAQYKEEHRLKYYNLLIEITKAKNENIPIYKLSNFAQLFIKTFEKNKIDINLFIKNEIESDVELKNIIKSKDLNY